MIVQTLRKRDESTDKQALDWNPHEARRRGSPIQTSKRAVFEEAVKCGKIWSDVKRGGATQSDGDASQMPYVPNGTNVCTTKPLLLPQTYQDLTFMYPCIVSIIVNDDQQDATIQVYLFIPSQLYMFRAMSHVVPFHP